MFKRMMNKNLGYIHFWIMLLVLGVFFPMHFIGMAGLPEDTTLILLFLTLMILQILILLFQFLLLWCGANYFFYNFIHSIYYGKETTQNPWKSTTLEWTAPIEHMLGIGMERFHMFIGGHMIIQNQEKDDYVPRVPLEKGE